MSTRAEPGSNAGWQAVRPAGWLRRAPLAYGLALAAACVLAAQPIRAQNRNDVIRQLRDDVGTATAHVSLEEKQTQKLDRSRQALLLALQSGGKTPGGTRKDLDGAVREIEKLFLKGLFLDEDRNTVMQDIRQLRALERSQRARANTRRWP
jgi:hypothetical protein